MSQFIIAETKVTCLEDILEALEELGISRDKVEIYATPEALQGYGGSQGRKAEVIVRKEHIGARYGDLGATKFNNNGEESKYYSFIVDDLDCQGTGEGCHGYIDHRWGTSRGGFVNHLAGTAALIAAQKHYKRKGWNVQRVRKENAAGKHGGYQLICTERRAG